MFFHCSIYFFFNFRKISLFIVFPLLYLFSLVNPPLTPLPCAIHPFALSRNRRPPRSLCRGPRNRRPAHDAHLRSLPRGFLSFSPARLLLFDSRSRGKNLSAPWPPSRRRRRSAVPAASPAPPRRRPWRGAARDPTLLTHPSPPAPNPMLSLPDDLSSPGARRR